MRSLASIFIPSARIIFAFMAYIVFYVNPASLMSSGKFIAPVGSSIQMSVNNSVG